MRLETLAEQLSRKQAYAAQAEALAQKALLQNSKLPAPSNNLNATASKANIASATKLYHTPGVVDAVLAVSLGQSQAFRVLELSSPLDLPQRILDKKRPLLPMLIPVDLGNKHITVLYFDPRKDSFKIIYVDPKGQPLPPAIVSALEEVGKHSVDEYDTSPLFSKKSIKNKSIVLNDTYSEIDDTAAIAIESIANPIKPYLDKAV